jgi:hypothetical protein
MISVCRVSELFRYWNASPAENAAITGMKDHTPVPAKKNPAGASGRVWKSSF